MPGTVTSSRKLQAKRSMAEVPLICVSGKQMALPSRQIIIMQLSSSPSDSKLLLGNVYGSSGL